MGTGEDGAERDALNVLRVVVCAGRSIELLGVRDLLSGIVRHKLNNNLSTSTTLTDALVCSGKFWRNCISLINAHV